jgi:hypothetical protein
MEETSEIDYHLLHEKIIEYLVNGNMHSTIVGKVIVLDGDNSKNDFIEATEFADYIISFLKQVSN